MIGGEQCACTFQRSAHVYLDSDDKIILDARSGWLYKERGLTDSRIVPGQYVDRGRKPIPVSPKILVSVVHQSKSLIIRTSIGSASS